MLLVRRVNLTVFVRSSIVQGICGSGSVLKIRTRQLLLLWSGGKGFET